MCLAVKSLVKIAEEDIVCYKHVLAVIPFNNTEKMRFYTLYQHMPVSIGETYTLEGKLEDCFYRGYESDFTSLGTVCVSRGAFHSYSFVSGDIAELAANKGEAIIECAIPKGTEYVEGDFCGRKSYASKAITYVRLLQRPYRE